jgi:hypothetical protein
LLIFRKKSSPDTKSMVSVGSINSSRASSHGASRSRVFLNDYQENILRDELKRSKVPKRKMAGSMLELALFELLFAGVR